MDVKLKALKVVELKAILAQANVQVPGKANKSDLIAKIIASNEALNVYNKLHTQDDLLIPPADLDWNSDQPSSDPKPSIPPKSLNPPVQDSNPVLATSPAVATESSVNEDPEAEKRKQRAARFGIPVVEPTNHQSLRAKNLSVQNGVKQPQSLDSTSEDLEKLKARAARFGVVQPGTVGQKRSAPTETIDPEEAEKRRKRAERFGTSAVKVSDT